VPTILKDGGHAIGPRVRAIRRLCPPTAWRCRNTEHSISQEARAIIDLIFKTTEQGFSIRHCERQRSNPALLPQEGSWMPSMPLAMTIPSDTHSRPAAPQRPGFCQKISALKIEGVGNAGCPMHPQPRVRNGSRMHTSIHSEAPENTRHSRTQWFYGLYALSPVS
jgi:hypothetical protein